MNDININYSNVEQTVTNIKSFVQTNIIEEVTASQETMLGTINDSAGDYIEALKTQIGSEAEVTKEIGNLLIKLADFIQEIAEQLQLLDDTYSDTKVK